MRSRATVIALLGLAVGLAWIGPRASGQPAGQTPEQLLTPATQPGGEERANPLPHVKLDRQRRQVSVECSSLPPGRPLELIACTPNTREHEALMTVKARPQHIHLALLLCGFEPGHPAGWDEKNEKPILPAGDRIEVLIQWTDPKTGQSRTEPIENWLEPIDPAKPVPKLSFLFTGSRQFENGQYWADMEGSVVSVSNFPDSVVDLAGEHSREDALLEFKGNAKVMPPAGRDEEGRWRGTPCVLILRPPAAFQIEIDRAGKAAVSGKPVSPQRLGELLAAHRRAREDGRVELIVHPAAPKPEIDKWVAQCLAAGFAADRVSLRAPASQPGE